MEFKGIFTAILFPAILVDIGTEWNLKFNVQAVSGCLYLVDIGTEWNLKKEPILWGSTKWRVDIGTEWNLKEGRE